MTLTDTKQTTKSGATTATVFVDVCAIPPPPGKF